MPKFIKIRVERVMMDQHVTAAETKVADFEGAIKGTKYRTKTGIGQSTLQRKTTINLK